MDYYAVIGHPIGHSKSPRIHALFAEQTGQALRYEAVLAPLDGFAGTVRDLVARGYRGFNVTVPFKGEAFVLADELTDRARRAGAVNTLKVEDDGRLLGENTDGVGLVTDLTRNLGIRLRDREVLVLGAGGAVRGVLAPLLAEGPAGLHIANRTGSRAEELARDFADLGPVTGGDLDSLRGRHSHLLINGTSAGLDDEVPPLPDDLLRPGVDCYDMMYGDRPTAFLRWAVAHGAARTADGLGMLVEQAAESFALWRGIRPRTAPVIRVLRPVQP
ncbi:shikimate dehydrogenase [Thioalkalivibrio thiocyanodenitrificans]|uniref:shikimate dehydrogenase n=1 Tax=Thioalkalivibrio thiocyanodenitrificans TaxID=243063 RepID=UPI000375FA70|nr:shikimate dehydrogenase [Thioalkalivibrio thiocyanodenitrificans]